MSKHYYRKFLKLVVGLDKKDYWDYQGAETADLAKCVIWLARLVLVQAIGLITLMVLL